MMGQEHCVDCLALQHQGFTPPNEINTAHKTQLARAPHNEGKLILFKLFNLCQEKNIQLDFYIINSANEW